METDASLLNAARTMDEDALVRIFERYASPLYKYAFRLCGDPIAADQIVGDVFVRLLEQLSAGNGPTANLRSYLYETTYHRIVDEARYAQRRVPLEAAQWLDQSADSPFVRLEDRIMFEEILHAIRHVLTEDQRHVIILRFMEEFSLRETAAIMGKTIDHVKVIQLRGIAALRKFLDDQRMRKAVTSPKVRKLPKTFGI